MFKLAPRHLMLLLLHILTTSKGIETRFILKILLISIINSIPLAGTLNFYLLYLISICLYLDNKLKVITKETKNLLLLNILKAIKSIFNLAKKIENKLSNFFYIRTYLKILLISRIVIRYILYNIYNYPNKVDIAKAKYIIYRKLRLKDSNISLLNLKITLKILPKKALKILAL
ncbi:hypothetical protein T310_10090 [Rasamsonia emersonii CBS 393.64]|uniref:Uncharacterized protein n=1 Tax=Rasamsonia emersonii (strain ATCC 16479 / CBS 393.64 / IMI 116815) TaxID=1408163 RepID=A0A0F4YDV9_RASE3|nr:hypothetical protein T310_10090 [Rasamsonia emersonii CBS 393.64]KKA16320.1 hypothetical protein T310_10090 [Rasamsonia emersonii CBS 393.64]